MKPSDPLNREGCDGNRAPELAIRNIIDMDMDFFLTYQSNKSLDRSCKLEVWTNPQAIFEKILDIDSIIISDMHVFEEHDEAFDILTNDSGQNLNIYHFDAHSDLYCSGAPALELLRFGYRPCEGNFLRFVLEKNAIRHLTCVIPDWFDKMKFFYEEVPLVYQSRSDISVRHWADLALPQCKYEIVIARSVSYTPMMMDTLTDELINLIRFRIAGR